MSRPGFVLMCILNWIYITGTSALNCLECDDLYKPHYCDIVTTCAQGEECFIDQYVTSAGNTLYKSGCRSTERCGITKRQTADDVANDETSDIIVCTHCCNGTDYCNLGGCQEFATPRQQRGPYCFDCKKQSKGGCRHIKQCDVHYSCEITSEQLNNETVYNSQCVHTLSSDNCNANTVRMMPSIVGKRDQIPDNCPKCCEQDFCNQDCNPVQPVSLDDGQWSSWNTWSICSVTCGQGSRQRSRSCDHPPPALVGKPCVGNATQTETCGNNCNGPVNGAYSQWSNWGACDVTCGNHGNQIRTRLCNNPLPSNGGAGCKGDSANTRHCRHLPACHDQDGFTPWGQWTSCPHTCGGTGHQYRHRKCVTGNCNGNANDDRSCHYQNPCPVDGGFSEWSKWYGCTKTCGDGLQMRDRTCNHPVPAHGGKLCVGVYRDTKQCHNNPCPHHPVGSMWFEVWSAWTPCSVTCGPIEGIIQRTKTCYDKSHHVNMSLCTQPLLEQMGCNVTRNCPIVNGGWSSWTQWGVCTSTCARGYQERKRMCNKPWPANGGKQCDGDDMERKLCNNNGKCNDSGFSQWGQWSHCRTCCSVHQMKFRTRTCPHGTPGKHNCIGPLRETLPCWPTSANTANQKVDGGWSSWGRWSRCSSSCSHGQQTRTRVCNKPKPQYGGHDCTGNRTDTKPCTSSCPRQECESVPGYYLYMYKIHVTRQETKAYLCLHYSNYSTTWFRASKQCRHEGGTLAAFDAYSEDEQAFANHIHNAYPSNPHAQIWIGLQLSNKGWHWEDGAHIGYYARHKLGSNYDGVQATNTSACIVDDGVKWIPLDCNERRYFMCERIID